MKTLERFPKFIVEMNQGDKEVLKSILKGVLERDIESGNGHYPITWGGQTAERFLKICERPKDK